MHRALQIQEILLNIFDYCSWRICDLPALARTCRTFKEPALDILWEELDDLFPLINCLPLGVFELSSEKLSMIRQLTRTEWSVLQSYACRVRSMWDFNCNGLDHQSLKILSNPPAGSLFPNLITVGLTVGLEDPHWFQDSIEFLPNFSPNVKDFTLEVDRPDLALTSQPPLKCNIPTLSSSHIRSWQNLQRLRCPLDALDTAALGYLSRMPTLTQLSLLLNAISPIPNTPLSFSYLRDVRLQSDSYDSVKHFLSYFRLPAVTDFTAYITHNFSRRDLASFWVTAQTSSADHAIFKDITLEQPPSSWLHAYDPGAFLLGFEDLQPCMAFINLQRIKVDIRWEVDLTDSELLALAPAWPRLEHLSINICAGWGTRGGITPNGLLQLLQACRLLAKIALAIDTRGHTKLPSKELMEDPSLALPRKIDVDVIDSIIEAESVPAMATFFAAIALPGSHFLASPTHGYGETSRLHRDYWHNVFRWVEDMFRQRSSITIGTHANNPGFYDPSITSSGSKIAAAPPGP